MMKTFTLILALLVSNLLTAGNLKIINIYGQDITGQDVVMWGDKDATLEYDAYVISNATSAKSIKAKRIENSLVASTENYFCWDVCYNATTSESPSSITMNPGDTVKTFHGYYEPYGIAGESVVTYVFFDMYNRNDSAFVRVHFNGTPAGIKSVKPFAVSAAYPNPANSVVNFNLDASLNSVTDITITNIAGVTVKREQAEVMRNKLAIRTEDLPNGIYFVSFFDRNKVLSSRKIIVAH